MILLIITSSTSAAFIEITNGIIITLMIGTGGTFCETCLCYRTEIFTNSAPYSLTRRIIVIYGIIGTNKPCSTMILLCGTIRTTAAFIEVTNSIIIALMIGTGGAFIDTRIGTWTPIFTFLASETCLYGCFTKHIDISIHARNSDRIWGCSILPRNGKGSNGRNWTGSLATRQGTRRYNIFLKCRSRNTDNSSAPCHTRCLRGYIDYNGSTNMV